MHQKPGRLSAELIAALGITENAPPPWIMNMQRYGPPPAYPNLKIPGVNIPIPDSLQGEEGLFKDENNMTVYADCNGLRKDVYEQRMRKKTYWGEINEEDEEEIVDEDIWKKNNQVTYRPDKRLYRPKKGTGLLTIKKLL